MVFANGVTHRGPYKDGPGEINVAIAIAGMVVEPGDLICGDLDGLVSVPYDAIETVYRDAEKKHAAETQHLKDIQAGLNDRTWIDRSLAKLGCAGA